MNQDKVDISRYIYMVLIIVIGSIMVVASGGGGGDDDDECEVEVVKSYETPFIKNRRKKHGKSNF